MSKITHTFTQDEWEENLKTFSKLVEEGAYEEMYYRTRKWMIRPLTEDDDDFIIEIGLTLDFFQEKGYNSILVHGYSPLLDRPFNYHHNLINDNSFGQFLYERFLRDKLVTQDK